jgi:hypothetical protein
VVTIAWALPRPDRRQAPLLFTVGTAHAAPGGRFDQQAIAPTAQVVSRVALAVAPDGWALLAYDDTDGIHALERRPGAHEFTEAFVDQPAVTRATEASGTLAAGFAAPGTVSGPLRDSTASPRCCSRTAGSPWPGPTMRRHSACPSAGASAPRNRVRAAAG